MTAESGRLDAPALVSRLRATVATGRTREFSWRDAQLLALQRMLADNQQAFVDALYADLGRPVMESWVADVRALERDFEHIRKTYRTWAAERPVKTPTFFRPGRSTVRSEPLGVVLILAPWNYPVNLLLAPLAAALSAGNAAVCKPSELAPATSALLARLAAEYLDPDAVVFVEGGVAEADALLEQRWDHIFYTGGGAVGRIVLQAAARHLTPVTLELGGRSPAIVHSDATLRSAVESIANARFVNAGQTCIAANHVWVHADIEQEFLDRLTANLVRRYGSEPRQSPDFGRIVNARHVERLAGLITGGGYDAVACGGDFSAADRYVAPTVLRGVKTDAPVMREEIFGPVLPVLTYTDIAEPIAHVNAGEKPLALYLFSNDDDVVERVLTQTSSGGTCVNDTLNQFGNTELPFGGVGGSGMGAYHGRTGFDTFSHRKAVFRRPARYFDPGLLRPPYSKLKTAALKKIF